jgi:hypothetical protein
MLLRNPAQQGRLLLVARRYAVIFFGLCHDIAVFCHETGSL